MAVNKSSFNDIQLVTGDKIYFNQAYITCDGNDIIFIDNGTEGEMSLGQILDLSGRDITPHDIDATGYIAADSYIQSTEFRCRTVYDDDFDLNDVLNTTVGSNRCGLVLVTVTTDGATGLFRVENSNVANIGSNALFSTTKDTASSYNFYFEDSYFRVQNKYGDNKSISLGLITA